jgi:hypothetical protein
MTKNEVNVSSLFEQSPKEEQGVLSKLQHDDPIVKLSGVFEVGNENQVRSESEHQQNLHCSEGRRYKSSNRSVHPDRFDTISIQPISERVPTKQSNIIPLQFIPERMDSKVMCTHQEMYMRICLWLYFHLVMLKKIMLSISSLIYSR